MLQYNCIPAFCHLSCTKWLPHQNCINSYFTAESLGYVAAGSLFIKIVKSHLALYYHLTVLCYCFHVKLYLHIYFDLSVVMYLTFFKICIFNLNMQDKYLSANIIIYYSFWPWRWRWHMNVIDMHISTRQHGVTFQKTVHIKPYNNNTRKEEGREMERGLQWLKTVTFVSCLR